MNLGMMEQLLQCIWRDLVQASGYIPAGFLMGCMVLAMIEIVCYKNVPIKNKVSGFRKWIFFLCAIYAGFLLQLAYFSREPGSRNGISPILFETWGSTAISHAYFIENILLFLPFGILFPMGFAALRKGIFCILAGMFSSICLELMQLFSHRGFCQLDDVVTNTLGTAIGWGIYRVIAGLSDRYLRHRGRNC